MTLTDTPRKGLTLAFIPLALTYLAVAVNVTIANIAVPTISTSLDADTADLAWIVNATPLASAAVILFAGAVADRVGRTRVLLVGILVFMVSALLCLGVTTPGELIGVRALSGVGSALAMPAAMALVFDVLSKRAQPTGIGIMSATQALGSLLGPLLGGAVLLMFWWGAAFLVVVPFLVIAFVMSVVLLPRSTPVDETSPAPLDLPAAILMAIAGGGLLYALIEGSSSRGGSALGWATAGGLGALAFAGLIWWESRCANPLIDLSIVRQRRFAVPTTMIFVVNLVLGGVMFLNTQYTQLVLGYSALATGLFLLPALIVWAVAAITSAKLARKFGSRRVIASAFVLSSIGLVTVGWGGGEPHLAVLVFGMALIGCMGVGPALLTHMAVDTFPAAKKTVGSSLNSLTLRFGLAFGVAGLASLCGHIYSSRVAAAAANLPQADAATASLGGAVRIANDRNDTGLLNAARDAFDSGFATSMSVAAVLLVIAAVVTAAFLPASTIRGERP